MPGFIRLRLLANFFDAARNGRKCTTIRMGKKNFSVSNLILQSGNRNLEAIIVGLNYIYLDELTEIDAKKDGFESLSELKESLKSIYPNSKKDTVFTVIEFALK